MLNFNMPATIWVCLLSFILHLSYYIIVNSSSSCFYPLKFDLSDHLKGSLLLFTMFVSNFFIGFPTDLQNTTFFIAQSRSKFFAFCHENIYSLLWFVIEIETTFLMIFFSGAKGSSLYKSCNTSEWEDQLLRNILLIHYQDNYLDKKLLD